MVSTLHYDRSWSGIRGRQLQEAASLEALITPASGGSEDAITLPRPWALWDPPALAVTRGSKDIPVTIFYIQ
jgi:hypothetical protein